MPDVFEADGSGPLFPDAPQAPDISSDAIVNRAITYFRADTILADDCASLRTMLSLTFIFSMSILFLYYTV